MEWFSLLEAAAVASTACGLMYAVSHDYVFAKHVPPSASSNEEETILDLPPNQGNNLTTTASCYHMILPNLYLSGALAAADLPLLQSKGITHILNTAKHEVENYFPKEFTYCNLDLVDFDMDVGVSRSFYEAFKFFHQSQRGVLLVHSVSGVNRAATVCVAILIYTHAYTLQQAISLVSSRAPHTCILQDNFLELAMLELACNNALNRPTMLWSETQQQTCI